MRQIILIAIAIFLVVRTANQDVERPSDRLPRRAWQTQGESDRVWTPRPSQIEPSYLPASHIDARWDRKPSEPLPLRQNQDSRRLRRPWRRP